MKMDSRSVKQEIAQEIDPHVYDKLMYDKGAKAIQ